MGLFVYSDIMLYTLVHPSQSGHKCGGLEGELMGGKSLETLHTKGLDESPQTVLLEFTYLFRSIC